MWLTLTWFILNFKVTVYLSAHPFEICKLKNSKIGEIDKIESKIFYESCELKRKNCKSNQTNQIKILWIKRIKRIIWIKKEHD